MAPSDRSHKTLSDAADQGRASRRRRFQTDGIDGLLHARPLGDVDRRRRLGAAAWKTRPPRASSARSATPWCRAGRKGNTRDYGDGSVSPRRARTRKPLICCANGRSPRRKAPAVAGRRRRAVRNSILNDAEVQKASRMREWLQSVIDSAKISKLGLPVVNTRCRIPRSRRCGADVDAVRRRSGHRTEEGA